jgi:ornithine carbamoyltransferase
MLTSIDAFSEEAGTTGNVTLTNDPAEALKDADVVITDTWCAT